MYTPFSSLTYKQTKSVNYNYYPSQNNKDSAQKLFSSERFHNTVSYRHEQKDKSSNQIMKGLNSSLDGLFSRIQAIKEEHNGRPKNQASIKEKSFENFPKVTLQPKTPKPTVSFKHFDFITETKPFTPKSHTKTNSNDWQFEFSKPSNPQQKKFFTSNNKYSQGLLNIPNLKASININDDFHEGNFKKVKNLEQMVTKESLEQNITTLMKSHIFEKKLTISDFDLGKCVGSGKFGDVHICKHKLTGFLFAIKKIFKSEIKSYNMIQQFTRQLKIHYRLNHPNIIKLYTHFDDEYHLFLLMEYCEGGVLMDKLQCTEKAASRYIGETINAISYLHGLKIAHRDIKPQNIVLQFNTVKVCDFGWSNFYQNQMKTTFCGTLDYLSPEMKDRGLYDNSVDVWSIGVLTYELIIGHAPYKNELQAWNSKGQPKGKTNWEVKYPTNISDVSLNFMKGLLKVNPDDRTSLRQCSNHSFIRRYKEEPEYSPYFLEISFLLH